MNTLIYDPNNSNRLSHFNAFDDSTRKFAAQKTKNVRSVLGEKHLAILRDPTNGTLCSKDGRRSNPNLPLAQAISSNYAISELMYTRLRQIAATEQYSGLVTASETELSSYTLANNIRSLTRAGIICKSTEYSSGYYIQLVPEARDFLNKGFAQIYLSDYVKTNLHPEEIYYDVTLTEERNLSERYKVDLIYRKDNRVSFAVIALNRKLTSMPAQIDKLVRISNRLRSSLTIVVSPSVDRTALQELLRSRLNYDVKIPDIVPYTRLMYLR